MFDLHCRCLPRHTSTLRTWKLDTLLSTAGVTSAGCTQVRERVLHLRCQIILVQLAVVEGAESRPIEPAEVRCPYGETNASVLSCLR